MQPSAPGDDTGLTATIGGVQGDATPEATPTETATERVARNWDEILQEVRVTQGGTQILLGFLLAIAFQSTFRDLAPLQVGVYLALVGTAALATILALAPVALHRALFRRSAKPQLVLAAHAILRVALAAIGLTLSGIVFLIVDVVVGLGAAIGAGAAALAVIAGVWVVVPVALRLRRDADPPAPSAPTRGA